MVLVFWYSQSSVNLEDAAAKGLARSRKAGRSRLAADGRWKVPVAGCFSG